MTTPGEAELRREVERLCDEADTHATEMISEHPGSNAHTILAEYARVVTVAYLRAALSAAEVRERDEELRRAVRAFLEARGRMCKVCMGLSPSWDGHDKNPPCEVAALEAMGAALDGKESADENGV